MNDSPISISGSGQCYVVSMVKLGVALSAAIPVYVNTVGSLAFFHCLTTTVCHTGIGRDGHIRRPATVIIHRPSRAGATLFVPAISSVQVETVPSEKEKMSLGMNLINIRAASK